MFNMPHDDEPERLQEKRCSACGEDWPADAEFFTPSAVTRDRLSPRCIACVKAGWWGNRPRPERKAAG